MQKNILDYLERSAEQYPDKAAYATEEEQWTFCQVRSRARAIGFGLAKRGYRGEPVVFYMDKTPAAVCTMFGVIYSGCFYVPLDEEMSPKRIGHILDNTRARVMICDRRMVESARKLPFDGDILLAEDLIEASIEKKLLGYSQQVKSGEAYTQKEKMESGSEMETDATCLQEKRLGSAMQMETDATCLQEKRLGSAMQMETDTPGVQEESLESGSQMETNVEAAEERMQDELLAQIRREQTDMDPVYILYTSGSTGVPKGVVGHHRALIDYIDGLSKVLGTDETSVFANQAPLYFDASMKELYLTICCGGTTWLVPKQLFLFPIRLVNYLNDHKINTICWVVSALTMISAFGTFDEVVPKYLRRVTFVGEVFPIAQFNLWKKALPDVAFTNLYGPTECTGVSCYYPADRLYEPGEPIPIGYPLPNREVFVLREDGCLADEEEEGEICIRGTCVAHGYYRDPERTKAAFVQNPLQSAFPDIIYRTGDIGKVNVQGELIFVSRRDHQIKHMGHRIELGEIEANVSDVADVTDCCCIFAKEEQKLVLFYAGAVDERSLTKELKGFLPRYMLPNRTIRLDELPHTPTGKRDRIAMEQLYQQSKRKRKERPLITNIPKRTKENQ